MEDESDLNGVATKNDELFDIQSFQSERRKHEIKTYIFMRGPMSEGRHQHH